MNIKELSRKLLKFFKTINSNANSMLKGQLDDEKVIFLPEIVSESNFTKLSGIIEQK